MMGQSVPSCQGRNVPSLGDNVSTDFRPGFCEIRRMIDWIGEEEFNQKLCARVARLRSEREWTQEQMAAAIGVPFERYKKYETRSPLPHYLIPRFALQVDRDVAYVLTGKAAETVRRGPRRLVRTGTDD